MVIDMDETRLRTIEQLEEFLRATPEVAFTAAGVGGAADSPRYEHISCVLMRFDYPPQKARTRRGAGLLAAHQRLWPRAADSLGRDRKSVV